MLKLGLTKKIIECSCANVELPIPMESEEPDLASAATDQPTKEQISKKKVS